MASRADKLKDLLGGNMAESMGAKGAGDPLAEVASASPGSTSGPTGLASKHDGVKPLREARLIRLENIAADPDQPRLIFDTEALDHLAMSLVTHGQLQPIRVRWSQEQGKYLIVAGERRWRAAKLADIESLQAVVVDRDLTPSEILQEQLVENCLREDLQPIEQAKAFKTLMESNGWSARKLADELQIVNSTVIKALALLDLAPSVQNQVEAGKITPATAYEVSKLDSVAEQVEVAERVVTEKLTRDQTADVVRSKSGKEPKEKASSRSNPTVAKPQGKVQFRLDDGTLITVFGLSVDFGPDGVVIALERALEMARRQVMFGEAA